MNRKLLTAEGYQRLQDELNDLVRKERPEITKIVSWAASLGDRSENADSTTKESYVKLTVVFAF